MEERRGLRGGRLWVFDTLPSTNAWALEHLAALAPGDAVRAVRQTAGYGRFGRSWNCPADRALAVSYVWLPPPAVSAAHCTQAAAVAVAETVAACGADASLKWPNDVLVGGRKVAGILAEQRGADPRLVLGVGLNVNLTAADLARHPWGRSATSLRLATGQRHAVDALLDRLTERLAQSLEGLAEQGFGWVLERWRRRDALRGRRIAVRTPQGRTAGLCLGVGAAGQLRLRRADGGIAEFLSGDVTLRAAAAGRS